MATSRVTRGKNPTSGRLRIALWLDGLRLDSLALEEAVGATRVELPRRSSSGLEAW